ncbi:GTP-binding protein lepa [Sistotremastrum niveocremeum HHB9708]|uniref:GTP-binding protein lepa n=1 Tax=Sistotremastrum niveocremeum HHB9708 TaxID=1314777 RepID=A0A164P4N2_9AGAM|nr:GTP-binding protein lepa [Sistotremastrum niveocremeum HHB9708]
MLKCTLFTLARPSATSKAQKFTRLNLSFSTSSVPHDAVNLELYPCDRIRNFSIIAHIDHGKSTLADRQVFQVTGTIQVRGGGANQQVLDKLKVERERGITVKAQTATMFHTLKNKSYLLNLIDTPGHVDFAWEVSRSMAACQGALLLVDASQGVQAQSLSVFHVAKERGLHIIPVLNKIDLPAADPERVIAQMQSMFHVDPAQVISISAKSGHGIDSVLETIIDRIPPPPASRDAPLKALLFDSTYDRYRGVISLVSVQDGILRKNDKIVSCYSNKKYDVIDVGIMHPEEESTGVLYAGQVGYIACNMKQSSEAHIGDTLHRVGEPVAALAGFSPMKAMVFAGVFPLDNKDFLKLEESIKRLTLTDRSVTIQRESSTALGQGCRLGFLGTLHLDVFRQRLEDEYEANIIVTAPTVPYRIVYKDKTITVSNPTDFPDPSDYGVRGCHVEEPIVRATIIVPQKYLGEMMELCSEHRAEDIDHHHIDASDTSARVILTCHIPLAEIVSDFFEKLKSRSSGFASFDYEEAGYKQSDLSKMTFLLNHQPVDALAVIVHRSALDRTARTWVAKLKKVIPRQQFEVPIQAAVGRKVLARETLSAYRKDVTAGLYGGHYERKMKHLENQKEGKKKMKKIGKVDLPQEAFFDILGSTQKK